jgi:hypothetical protein
VFYPTSVSNPGGLIYAPGLFFIFHIESASASTGFRSMLGWEPIDSI